MFGIKIDVRQTAKMRERGYSLRRIYRTTYFHGCDPAFIARGGVSTLKLERV